MEAVAPAESSSSDQPKFRNHFRSQAAHQAWYALLRATHLDDEISENIQHAEAPQHHLLLLEDATLAQTIFFRHIMPLLHKKNAEQHQELDNSTICENTMYNELPAATTEIAQWYFQSVKDGQIKRKSHCNCTVNELLKQAKRWPPTQFGRRSAIINGQLPVTYHQLEAILMDSEVSSIVGTVQQHFEDVSTTTEEAQQFIDTMHIATVQIIDPADPVPLTTFNTLKVLPSKLLYRQAVRSEMLIGRMQQVLQKCFEHILFLSRLSKSRTVPLVLSLKFKLLSSGKLILLGCDQLLWSSPPIFNRSEDTAEHLCEVRENLAPDTARDIHSAHKQQSTDDNQMENHINCDTSVFSSSSLDKLIMKNDHPTLPDGMRPNSMNTNSAQSASVDFQDFTQQNYDQIEATTDVHGVAQQLETRWSLLERRIAAEHDEVMLQVKDRSNGQAKKEHEAVKNSSSAHKQRLFPYLNMGSSSKQQRSRNQLHRSMNTAIR